MRVAIIDAGLGNLRSASKAFEHFGVEAPLVDSPAELEKFDALVLPGQGHFGDCMNGLEQRGLVEPLKKLVSEKRPLLGICVGVQLFFEESEESPGTKGLGLLKGKVKKFVGPEFGANTGLKVPHMGWNALEFKQRHPLFDGLADGTFVYFVHSFFVVPDDESDVMANSKYGQEFCSIAGRENVVGCQFHPEKSQKDGLKIIENFLKWVQSK